MSSLGSRDVTITTARRRPGGRIALALALAGLGAGLLADAAARPTRFGATRGISTDQGVDLPLDPSGEDAPRPTSPITRIRIAVKGGDAPAGLEERTAPIDVVAADARPDLVWEAGTGDLRERDEIVARGVAVGDLPAAADRLALVRRLRDLVQQGGQSIRVSPEGRAFKIGTDIDLTLPQTAGRSVVAAAISGTGTVTLLWPLRGDPAVAEGDVTLQVTTGEPIGVDQLMVLSSDRSLAPLAVSLRRLDRRRAAGEVLGLIDRAAGPGLLVGLQSIATQR